MYSLTKMHLWPWSISQCGTSENIYDAKGFLVCTAPDMTTARLIVDAVQEWMDEQYVPVKASDVLQDLKQAVSKTAAQVRAYHEQQSEGLNELGGES